MVYWTKSVEEIAKNLDADLANGLSAQEREKRLLKFGLNKLPAKKNPNIFEKFLEQIKNPIVILLLLTAIIAAVVGDMTESILIGSIVFIISAIGVYLEQQSEKSLKKLEDLQAIKSRVLVDGKMLDTEVESIVPGDIIIFFEGDIIPADARIIEASGLKVNESSLTGESIPVSKSLKILDEAISIGDRSNSVFASTSIIEGSGKAIVVDTAINTELGKIAANLANTEEGLTPLQKELELLSKFLFISTIIVSIGILIVYIARGEELIESLITTMSLAIAFIPEGLSAVLTITLALAVGEMVKKKVIVKKLLAAEALGSINYIGTDKTGTMTEGKMKVIKVYVDGKIYDAEDELIRNFPRIIDVIRYCNNNKGPTEEALVSFLNTHGYNFEIEGRKVEYNFNSSLKRMSVVKSNNQGDLILFSKGAPEILIPMCKYNLDLNQEIEFTQKEKDEALKAAEMLASQGYRILALADRKHNIAVSKSRAENEDDLVFVGLVALMDNLRPTVTETIKLFKESGVMPFMITGDHPAIAKHIAFKAGLIENENDENVILGSEIDEIFSQNIIQSQIKRLINTKVYARVSPQHKLMIIEMLQSQGYRVAMTGDGVNDAAAIKKADVGIAMSNGMGITKDIADVIITGSYDALHRAISIGRTVKLRTQLYIHYLLSGNACEVGIFFVAVFLEVPIPLTPIMLLVINLLTDALPAVSMAVEKEDPDIMKIKVNKLSPRILSKEIIQGIFIQGLISTILLSVIYLTSNPKENVLYAQTSVFILYVFQKILRGFTARSFHKSVFTYGFFTNKLMNISILMVLIFIFLMLYPFSSLLNFVELSPNRVLVLFSISLILPLVEELTKLRNRAILRRSTV